MLVKMYSQGEINNKTVSAAAREPVRLLPLYGTVRLPSLTSMVLKEHRALGANTVLVCITEEDFLYYRENVTKVILVAAMMGFRVYANAWGYGGLMGGEALSATDLHFKLAGKKAYLNSVHHIGPDAPVTASNEAITDSPLFQLMRLQELVAAAGAETFFYDEFKIERPGRPHQPGHVPLETFVSLAEHAHSLGLRNSLCVSVIDEADLALVEQLVRLDCVDEIGFTRYYGPNEYAITPEEYLGPSIDQLSAAIAGSGRAEKLSVLGWAQGFDLRSRGDVLTGVVEAWRKRGVQNIGIWGGFCVNETPMLTPSGHSYLYPEIAEAFHGASVPMMTLADQSPLH